MNAENPFIDSEKFRAALRRFDEENSRDPNSEIVNGVACPREMVFARRLADCVLRLEPDASEELRLASHCQHLCRWMIPRNTFPMARAGYLQWRHRLKQFHAEKAGEILREVGYADEVIARVKNLILKNHFPDDAESRVLEDALCLVFLKWQFSDLVAKTDDEKMINALKKTWRKMTPRGQAE
ncbi:MAG TPA: DUF4202 domain-containing protein, partial [Verrucomicrobiae bacterium]|nr:DUF4202 domain-containing protein [Verrucomicrobiae bacterium]